MKSLDHKRINRILIRMTNWIGDAVMTTPALRAIRESFPDAEISVLANPIVAQLFVHHPDCDRVLLYDKTGRHAGVIGFSTAIAPGFISFLSGIPLRADYATEGRRLLLTHPVSVGEAEKALHHTDYYLEMLARLDITCREKVQSLALTDEEREWAAAQLPEGPVAVINPGELSQYNFYEFTAFSLGEPINFIGKTTVRQMMALLASSNIMVTNDSGPMHVGAALDVPLVAIFGPTDHTTTSPLAKHWELVCKPPHCSPCLLRECPIDHRCMTAITAEDVNAAIQELMENPE